MQATLYGSVTQVALAEYFVKRYNMVGRDAEYQKNRWTLSQLPRDTESLKKGDAFYETVKIAGGWGGMPGWVEGNQYHSTSQKMRWLVEDPYAQYARITFDNLSLARNNLGTLIDIKGSEAEDVRTAMLNTLEFQLWSDGSGARAQIDVLGGTEGTRILTLKNPDDVYNLPHGTLFRGSTTATGAGTDHSDIYRVTAIDPLGGKITATQVTNTASQELADEDYLHVVNAKDAVMPGIPKFIPSTDPSDTFKGVVRSADPATSGWRFSFRNSISETIQYAFAKMGRFVDRAKGKYVVCLSVMDFYRLAQEREGRIMEDPGAMQKWGVTGLVVNTHQGPITCVAVDAMSDGRGYIIDWSTWKLYTLKNLPHVVDEDGQPIKAGGIGTVSGNEHVNGDFVAMQFRIWTEILCLQPLGNATFATR